MKPIGYEFKINLSNFGTVEAIVLAGPDDMGDYLVEFVTEKGEVISSHFWTIKDIEQGVPL